MTTGMTLDTLGEIPQFGEKQNKSAVVQQLVDCVSSDSEIEAVVYLADENHVLRPIYFSGGIDGASSIEASGQHSVFRSYRDETVVPVRESVSSFLDLEMTPAESNVFSLGTHGVFVVTAGMGFESSTSRLLELFAGYAKTALDGIQCKVDVRELEQTLEEQASRYEDMERIISKIRKMDQALIQAHSRDEIERVVCERLLTSDRFVFVWIGELNADGERLHCRHSVGAGDGYLDEVSFRVTNSGGMTPACRTAKTGDVTVVSDVTNVHNAPWRDPAIQREFRSIASIPLIYEDIVYAVVTIYTDERFAFGELPLSVLTEMGETIGYAINAARVKQTLTSKNAPKIRFQIRNSDDPFFELAESLDCQVEIRTVTAKSSESYTTYVTIRDVDPEWVREAIAAIDPITSATLIGNSDSCLYEFVITKACIPVLLANLGAKPRSISVMDDRGIVSVTVPPETDVRSFVDQVQTTFTTAEPIARLREETTSGAELYALTESLTDRQREVLEVAYFSGFFEWPRHSTGEEIADSLGISQPAFLQHLRAAERKLVGGLYEYEAAGE